MITQTVIEHPELAFRYAALLDHLHALQACPVTSVEPDRFGDDLITFEDGDPPSPSRSSPSERTWPSADERVHARPFHD